MKKLQTFEIEVENSLNGKDGRYIIQAYSSEEAIGKCRIEEKVRISQSGTTFTARLKL